MMTKEEVAQVIAYCDENKIGYKRKYAPKDEGENSGEFLQLVPGGSFLPNPIKPSRSRSSRQKDSAQGAVAVSIELRTPTGTMMRISGNQADLIRRAIGYTLPLLPLLSHYVNDRLFCIDNNLVDM